MLLSLRLFGRVRLCGLTKWYWRKSWCRSTRRDYWWGGRTVDSHFVSVHCGEERIKLCLRRFGHIHRNCAIITGPSSVTTSRSRHQVRWHRSTTVQVPALETSLDDIGGASGIFSTTKDKKYLSYKVRKKKIKRTRIVLPFSYFSALFVFKHAKNCRQLEIALNKDHTIEARQVSN